MAGDNFTFTPTLQNSLTTERKTTNYVNGIKKGHFNLFLFLRSCYNKTCLLWHGLKSGLDSGPWTLDPGLWTLFYICSVYKNVKERGKEG